MSSHWKSVESCCWRRSSRASRSSRRVRPASRFSGEGDEPAKGTERCAVAGVTGGKRRGREGGGAEVARRRRLRGARGEEFE